MEAIEPAAATGVSTGAMIDSPLREVREDLRIDEGLKRVSVTIYRAIPFFINKFQTGDRARDGPAGFYYGCHLTGGVLGHIVEIYNRCRHPRGF